MTNTQAHAPASGLTLRRQSGFTLIEILAATGIMVVIIMLVLALTTNVLSSWTRASGQLQNNFEARVALDLLQSDLESMVVRNRNIPWLEVAYESVADFTSSPILFFFAPTLERPRQKDDGSPILGDVCAISYRLAYRNPFTSNTTRGTPPPPIYGLYRSVIDSENTFNQALAIENHPTGRLSTFWNSADARAINEDGEEVLVSSWVVSSGNFLSQNVAKFETVFWYRVGNADPVAIPVNTPFIYAGSGLYIDGSTSPVPGARLAFVDVTLTVISQEGASILNQGTTGYDYDRVLLEFGDVFTRRINLMSNPL